MGLPATTRLAALRGPAGYFLALLVVVTTWAVGVPRFASPDEAGHVYKAYATAHGELLGKPSPGVPNNLREFDGPASLGQPDIGCFIGKPDVPASCQGEGRLPLISGSARYPPWYYGLVGAPVAVSGQSGRVLAYRLVSAVFCVALLALAMSLAKRSVRADLVALQLAALTPMALFLMASVNPNAIEIAGFVAIWACLSRVLTDPQLPPRLLIFASWLSAAVILMRPVAILWMAGVVVVALIGANPIRRRELLSRRIVAWAVGPNLLALVVSWLWALYARFEVKDARLLNSLSLAGALRRSALDWFRYLRQTIGVLGWVDTYLPFFVYAAWFAALVLIIAMHLRTATSRGIAALGVLVAGLLALPLIINGFTNSRAGLTFQGRYSLPLFAGLVFLPTWSQRSTRRLRIVAQQWLIAAVLALVVVAEIGAFWQTLRRFTVGANAKVVLTGPLSWSPAVAPMLLIAINGVAMVAAAWSAWRPWGALWEVEAATGERDGQGAEHGADRSG